MPHWRLFYHLVWATQDRQPLLATAAVVRVFEQSVELTCRDLHVFVHGIGTMPDHVHLACSIPPNVAISEFMRRLKGGSSRRLNETAFARSDDVFSWQAEYGVYSFTERVLPDVVAYVLNQPIRHAANDLWPAYERMERAPTPSLPAGGVAPPT